MNTIRFFLLLFSLFLFAFIFQAHLPKVALDQDVLSHATSEVTEELFLYFTYPRSQLQQTTEHQRTYLSHDSLVEIVGWYEKKLSGGSRISIGKNPNQTITLTGRKDGKKIQAHIVKKQGNPRIIITVTITAS